VIKRNDASVTPSIGARPIIGLAICRQKFITQSATLTPAYATDNCLSINYYKLEMPVSPLPRKRGTIVAFGFFIAHPCDAPHESEKWR